MRVLRVSHSAVVEEWRGRERALRALGVDVTLLTAHRWDEAGAPVVLTVRPDEQASPVRTWGRHPALVLSDPRPLWHALGERWDVVDIHEEPFALATAEILLLRALRRNRAPLVLYTAQNLRKRYPIPFRWMERHALRSAAGISACNSEAAHIAMDKGFPGLARVIPLGVELERFRPDGTEGTEAGDGPPPTAERITVGFLGRLVPEKGLLVLLDAAARDPRLHVRIAGGGPLAADLPALATARGISDRVEFIGHVSPDEVIRFYRDIDVLAVPSLPTASWTEQFGRVAIEAMACGVPVVSSDAGALPDVIRGAGIVVRRADAAALADAIVQAAGPRRAELRAAGFARAAECSWQAVAGDYFELYSGIVRDESASAAREVEIVVVAYGTPELLRAALEPVRTLPVTVVDNSSMPQIAQLCADLGVRYIDSGSNRGFAGAVNIALADRQLPGADVLLLNPDARIATDQLGILHRALLAKPDLASAGPMQTDEDGRSARVSWFFPTPAKAWLEALGLARLQRGARFVIGSVLLLRAEALAQVGGFDDSFFLYAEETDWAYRAHLLGWRHAEVRTASAVHIGAATSADTGLRDIHFPAAQERYYRKHFGAAGWQTARAAAWFGAVARSVALRGARADAARRRAALYRRGPLRVEAAMTGGSPA